MVLYWIIVFLFIFFLFFIRLGKRNARNSLLIIFSFIFFILLVTFRPLEIPDTESYKDMVEEIDKASFSELFSSIDLLRKEPITGAEYGFVFLIKTLLLVFPANFRLIFFLIALIESVFLYIFIKHFIKKKEKRVDFVYYLIPYFGLMYFLVVLRGGLCLSICLAAFALTKGRRRYLPIKFLLSLLLYFVAFTMHRFALIFIFAEIIFFLIPVAKEKSTYWILWASFGAFVLLIKVFAGAFLANLLVDLFSSNELLSHYSKYLVQDGSFSISFRSVFFWILGGVILSFLSNKQFASKRRFFNIYLFGVLVMGIFSFVPGASRISDFLFCFIPLMMVDIDYDFKKKKQNFNLLVSSEIVYSILGVIIMIRL